MRYFVDKAEVASQYRLCVEIIKWPFMALGVVLLSTHLTALEQRHANV